MDWLYEFSGPAADHHCVHGGERAMNRGNRHERYPLDLCFTARVSDLRRDGVALDVETVTQKNRYGETVRFARYRRKE
nr:MAG TPA: helix-turn-helix domain protein [Caudoviricetes sp.]